MKAWILVCVITTLFVTGCASQATQPQAKEVPSSPKAGGTLYLAHMTDPPDLDAFGTGITRQYLTSPAYNGLIMFDPMDNSKILPDLADKWEASPDGKTYTFFLNKNAKWHDGSPVTAKDIKYNYDTKVKAPVGICCGTGKTPSVYMTEVLAGTDVVDDSTVRFRLKRASSSFLSNLVAGGSGAGIALIAPAAVAGDKQTTENTVMGSGPFKFVSYTRGTSFKLTKNPNYFKPGLPYIDNIEFFILPDASTLAAAFRASKIDVTPASFEAISNSQAETVAEQMKAQARVEWGDGLEIAGARMNQAKPPFNNPKVRAAVNLAIDRQRGIKTLAQGHAEMATNLQRIPGLTRFGKDLETVPGYRPNKEQDLAEAKRLLDEAGYKAGADGKRMSIVAMTRGGAGWERFTDAAVFFKDEMAKIGIDAKVDPVTQDLTANRQRAGDWDAEVRFPASVFLGPVANASNFIGEEAYGAYTRSAERDKLYEDIDSTLDPAKQKELVRQLEDLLMKDLVFVPWHWDDYATGIMNYVMNFKPAIGSYANNRWENVWLNK